MKIVCIMKSQESYKRLKFQINDARVEWEVFISELEQIQERISVIHYDLAVIDEKVWWRADAERLFNSFEVAIVPFKGDFEEVSQLILGVLPPFEVEEELGELVTDFELPKIEEVEDERPVRYIETEKIIREEVKVEVPVYKEVYTNVPNKTIAVVNLSKRAGSTFITLNLAKAFADEKIFTSIVEPPIGQPYLFDAMGVRMILDENSNDIESSFYSIPHEIVTGRKVDRNKELILEGISFLIADPRREQIKNWSYEHMIKLLYSSKASVTFIDLGDKFQQEVIQQILQDLDLILVVIDPLPQEIQINERKYQYFNQLKQQGMAIEYLVNRWNSGVDHKEIIRELAIKPHYIPYIEPKFIYKAAFDCKIPYEYEEVKNELEKKFHPIMKEIIPDSFWANKPEKERGSIISKVWKRRK